MAKFSTVAQMDAPVPPNVIGAHPRAMDRRIKSGDDGLAWVKQSSIDFAKRKDGLSSWP